MEYVEIKAHIPGSRPWECNSGGLQCSLSLSALEKPSTLSGAPGETKITVEPGLLLQQGRERGVSNT